MAKARNNNNTVCSCQDESWCGNPPEVYYHCVNFAASDCVYFVNDSEAISCDCLQRHCLTDFNTSSPVLNRSCTFSCDLWCDSIDCYDDDDRQFMCSMCCKHFLRALR